MKKILIFSIAVIVLSMISSCEKAQYIKLDRHYVETNYEKQDLEFHTDENIVGFYGRNADLLEEGETNETISQTYTWFKLMIMKSDRKILMVHLDENNTDEDRYTKIYVSRTFPDDTVRIVQKAKPAL